VVARNIEVGQTVASSFATPNLFLIALDLTKMQVDTNVSESDIGGMAEGKEAIFTVDAYPGMSFAGIVKQVRLAPISVQNVVTYNVVVSVDNADLRLKPGMTANVSIVASQRDQVIKVPNAALRFVPPKGEGSARDVAGRSPKGDSARPVALEGRAMVTRTVWRHTDNGELVAVPVQTGISDGSSTEIMSGGLAEGDVIVIGIEQSADERRRNELPPGFGSPPRPRNR
jgi:HlyD family secretion protein